MDIQNHGNNLRVHFPVKNAAQNNDPASGSTSKNNVASIREPNSTPLLEQVESGEAIRKQLLTAIKAKIQAGEYSTRAAIEKAAENIVGL